MPDRARLRRAKRMSAISAERHSRPVELMAIEAEGILASRVFDQADEGARAMPRKMDRFA